MDKKEFEGLKKHDEEVYEKFVRRYWNKLYAYSLTVTRNPNIAEEVTQKVLIKITRKIHQVKKPEKFEPWIIKMTYRLCLDEMKSAPVKNEIPTEDYILDAYSNTPGFSLNDYQEFWKEFNTLSIENQNLMICKYVFEFSELELSSIFRMPLGTVKSKLHRAKNDLKTNFEKKNLSFKDMYLSIYPVAFFNFLNTKVVDDNKISFISHSAKKIGTIHLITKVSVSAISLVAIGVIGININRLQQIPLDQVEEIIYEPCIIESIDFPTEYVNHNIMINVKTSCKGSEFVTVNDNRSLEIEDNGTYIVRLLNEEEVLDEKEIHVNVIDKKDPIVASYEFIPLKQQYKVIIKDEYSGVKGTPEFLVNGEFNNHFQYNSNSGEFIFTYNVNDEYIINVNDFAGNSIKITIKELENSDN